jgi:hypothetical protein
LNVAPGASEQSKVHAICLIEIHIQARLTILAMQARGQRAGTIAHRRTVHELRRAGPTVAARRWMDPQGSNFQPAASTRASLVFRIDRDGVVLSGHLAGPGSAFHDCRRTAFSSCIERAENTPRPTRERKRDQECQLTEGVQTETLLRSGEPLLSSTTPALTLASGVRR